MVSDLKSFKHSVGKIDFVQKKKKVSNGICNQLLNLLKKVGYKNHTEVTQSEKKKKETEENLNHFFKR